MEKSNRCEEESSHDSNDYFEQSENAEKEEMSQLKSMHPRDREIKYYIDNFIM
jgi:hypothetical protein